MGPERELRLRTLGTFRIFHTNALGQALFASPPWAALVCVVVCGAELAPLSACLERCAAELAPLAKLRG